MKPAPFAYHAPEAVADAVALLAEFGDDAKALAGGQSLVPMLALRLARFEHLVDLNRIASLQGATRENGTLVVGAMTRQRAMESLADVPLLARAAPLIGHFQIRNRGTVGGSLAHADPASELPAVALALDAEFTLTGPNGPRSVAAADFFLGTWTTAVADDELLTTIRFPVAAPGAGYAIEEVARRHGDFALAGAVCAIQGERSALALSGVAPMAVRAPAAEAAIADGAPAELVADLAVRAIDPPADVHASTATRSKIAHAVVVRAVTRAREEARA